MRNRFGDLHQGLVRVQVDRVICHDIQNLECYYTPFVNRSNWRLSYRFGEICHRIFEYREKRRTSSGTFTKSTSFLQKLFKGVGYDKHISAMRNKQNKILGEIKMKTRTLNMYLPAFEYCN
jgi:hypothetical protein